MGKGGGMEEEKPRVNERRALALEVYKSGWKQWFRRRTRDGFSERLPNNDRFIVPPAIHLYIRQVIRRPPRPGLPGRTRSGH